ncbi:MAG: flagellin, partial [Planctomycetaceae bacterium]|nr:flagellin [Planctomycetaceae bacterium]
MTIYFSTNIPEMRSIFQLNRSSNKIADISHRLETGQRINSGKDDPEGLIIRDRLRADIKGLYTAKDNASRADNMLSIADSGLASLSKYILGETDDGTSGLKALIGSVKSDVADSDALKANISQILNQMNGVARSTTYNGKQIINGDLAYKTAFTSDNAKLSNLNISKANGGNQAVSVAVTAVAAKTQGKLELDTASINAEEGDSITVRYNGTAYKYTVGTNDLSGGGNEVSLTTLAEKVGTMLKGSGLNVTTDTSGATYDLVLEADNFGSSNTLFITLDSNNASGTELSGLTPTITEG